MGNVMDGVGETAGLLDRVRRGAGRVGRPRRRLREDRRRSRPTSRTRSRRPAPGTSKRTIEIAMDALRLPAGDADVTTLSGGERRRVALCRLLLSRPDLLLLDEPTNHLDAESVAWLERFLQRLPRHGRGRHPRSLLPRQRGRLDPRAGSRPGHALRGQLLELAGAEAGAPRAGGEAGLGPAAHAASASWSGCAWRRRPARPRARPASPPTRSCSAEAEADRGARDKLEIPIPPGDRLGDQVIEAEHLRKGYGDRLLIEDLSFSLPRAGIVGVIGPNGAGKTTLFRMLTGGEEPDDGTITRRPDRAAGLRRPEPRHRSTPNKTVYEEITDGQDDLVSRRPRDERRAYVAGFNFKGSDQQKKVGELSGGERNRVHLAKVLKEGGNVLLLDEPTNDLDVDTLRALEDAPRGVPGCAVVISHDRWFLDRIATHILAFEGDSQVRWFEGNFSEYEAFRHKELGAEADQPHRIKYKPLAR